ncbi:MAG: S-layer homology domain-containing protein [Oscillospiraceae bacterium]|nr:S-layer homology domain-containing protein [Oscillospiraceae bacterium]
MKKKLVAFMLAFVLVMGLALPAAAASFTDVASGAWYEEAVNWAVENGITTGVGNGLFAPNAACTRGQVVTFLWRSQGEPAPQGGNNPFTDVKEGDYFYDAVLWAVENGITTGLSATEFGPNSPCNRAQVVTFLWRSKGEPTADVLENPFTDVKEGDYFYDAVLWAVEKGITTGISATAFGPGAACNRGQIVTFLYRTPGEDSPEEDDGMIWNISSVKYTGKMDGSDELIDIFNLIYEYDELGRVVGAYTDIGTGMLSVQYGENGRPALATIISEDLKTTYQYVYDINGNYMGKFEGNVLVDGIYYELDEQGRLTREDYMDGSFNCSYRYTYNEAGLLATKENHSTGSHNSTEYYTYDAQGRLTKELIQGVFMPDYKKTTEYIYSDDGLTVTEKVLELSSSYIKEPCYTIVTVSDTAGNVVSKVKTEYLLYYEDAEQEPFTKVWDKETWSYSYDSQNRLLREEYVASGLVQAGPEAFYDERANTEVIEYTYGEGDLPIAKKTSKGSYSYSEISGYVFIDERSVVEESMSYNANGDIIASASKNYAYELGESGQPEYQLLNEGLGNYEYDAEGRLVRKLIESTSHTYSTTVSKTEYLWVYDSEGRLTEEVEDGDVNDFRKTWSYDEQGRLVKETDLFTIYNPWSDSTTVSSDRAYEYAYDEHGNVVSYKEYWMGYLGNYETYNYDSKNRLVSYETYTDGVLAKGSVKYNARNLVDTVTTYIAAQGITVTCKYNYEKKPDMAIDEITNDLLGLFDTLI